MSEDSLQDRKYISGLFGARGYEFEKSYILSQLPDWLASIDLEFFQQELWSDLELFFASGARWLVQIKNHPLGLTEFREIIRDFETRHQNSQGQYERYVIVSTGTTNSIREVRNIIARWSAIEHLGEPELTSTRLDDLSKLREHGLAEFAEFVLTNARRFHIISDASWIQDASLIKKIFVSKLNTDHKISQQHAENLHFRIAQRLADERGAKIELRPFRDELRQVALREAQASHPPFILPQLDVATFTGRSDELLQLQDLLLKPVAAKVCSIVGLAGSGGIGKSALACHFAEIHRGAFPEGVIGLRVDGKDNDAIAREFARLCGEEINPEDERDASTVMQEVFGHRRMLLIFDNAEDVTIQSLRPGGSSCSVIITTRDRQLPSLLGVPKEARIDLPPLQYEDALLLLGELIGVARVAAEPKAVDDVIGLVGSLPLALQIVGATLQIEEGRSIESYAASLAEERERLERLRIRGALHLDVRVSFSLSLKLLEATEIDFFACLSVCAQDGFSVQAAMAAGECDESQAHEWLGYLYRLSLLNRPQSSSHRFVFHPLIRLFAQEIAVDRSLQDDAAERHARFFIQMVKSSDAHAQRAATLAEELDDIILAAEWLQQRETSNYSFVISLQPFLQQHGYWQQAKKLMTGFLSLAEQQEDWRAVVQFRIQEAKYLSLLGDWLQSEKALLPIRNTIDRIEDPETRIRSEAMWLNTLGGVLQRQGRFDEAAGVFQRSSSIEEQLGNLRGQAKVLNSLGSVLQRQGDFEEATKAFRQSAEIEEQIGNQHGQAMMLNSLGGLLQRQGHFGEAIDSFEKSLDLLVRLGDYRGQAMTLNSLGGALQREGHFKEAIDALQRSAEIEEKIGNQRGQAMVLNSVGGVLQRQARFDEAIAAFQRSAEIERAIDNQHGQAMVLNSLGGVFQRQGRFDEAVEAFQHSYDLLVTLDDQRGQAMALNSLGGAFQRQGRFDEAVEAFQRSFEISDRLKDDRSLAMVLNSLGGVFQRQGRFDEAVRAFRRSFEISDRLKDDRSLAMVLNSLGGVFQRQGRFDEAVEAFQRSFEISDRLKDDRSLAMVLNSLGGVFQRQGRFDEAVEAFQRSFEISDRLKDDRSLAMVLNSLGGAFQRQGRFDEAVEAFQRSFEISDRLKDDRSLAMVLNSLGGVFQRQGRFDEAVRAFRRSFEISDRLKDDRSLAMVLNSLGGVFQRQGRFDEAVEAFQRSFEISDRLKDDRSLAMVLNSLGGVFQRQGRFDEAVEAFQRSFEISDRLKDDRSLAMVLNSLGGVFQRQGRFDEAVEAFQRSFDLLVTLDDQRGQAMVLNSLGGVFQRQGRFDEAVDIFRKSIAIGEFLDDKRHVAIVLNSLGGVFQRQGRFDEAVAEFQRSAEIEREIGNQRGQAMVLNSLGGVFQRQGRFDEAVEAFQRSFEISDRLKDDRSLAMVLNSLGGVFERQGRFDEAVEAFQRSYAISDESNDRVSLAMVHFGLGKTRLSLGSVDEAVHELVTSFEINESLKIRRGVAIVLPVLVRALQKLRRFDEAANYCQRALAVAPDDTHVLQLASSLSESQQTNKAGLKRGSIKRLILHPKGYRYGFIEPDDVGKTRDVYFQDRDVLTVSLPGIAEGVRVEFEVSKGFKGPQARRIRVIVGPVIK